MRRRWPIWLAWGLWALIPLLLCSGFVMDAAWGSSERVVIQTMQPACVSTSLRSDR